MKNILLISILTTFIVVPLISAGDFNGDGTGDVAVFRASTGLWAVRGFSRFYFGGPGDSPIPLNYNSSPSSVAAIFRPSSGLWAVRGRTRVYYGGSQDQPVTGDFNGDGLDEIGIFRPSSGLWAIRNRTRIYFGSSGDTPVPGDYDGDGTVEAGVFRSTSGLWALRGIGRVYFGGSSDLPVPADYDGDGLSDIGIFRSSSGLWAIRNVTRSYFGASGDIPQPLEITGDGRDKISVFRSNSGLWASKGISRIYYGGTGDFPVASPRYWSIPELPLLGIEVLSQHFDNAHFDKLIQAGANITRYGYISWARIEPTNTTPDNYNWGIYDELMADYGERGLSLILIIADIPPWAGPIQSGPFNDDARDDFAEFVGAAVNRYSRPPYNIKYWEFFNEPDGIKPLYGAVINTWGYYGREYALMLKEVYPAIKAADPSARVVMGGLAYDSFVDGDSGNFNQRFLNDVIENGGADYFDIMNFHYYYFSRETWGNIIGKANYLKAVLAWYGISKPMICSEVGIWGDETNLGIQARYVPKVFARGLSAGLETILWFPLATQTGFIFDGGLLRDEDLSVKPAYISYQTMTSELGDYTYSAVIATGDANLEGYKFISAETGKSKEVVWAQEDTSGQMVFPYEIIRMVTIEGLVHFIADGGGGDSDGSNNGQVRIPITSSPVYVESW
jgi:cellulase (glycosyl hydrolase family 5)